MLGTEWSDSWNTSLQSPKRCSLICPFLWTSHIQSYGGKGKGRIINFVLLFASHTRGFMGDDSSTCVQCFELIIKSLCLVMVFIFSHYKALCICHIWSKKTKLAYQIWMPWWRKRERSQQSCLHCIAVAMTFSLGFVCLG